MNRLNFIPSIVNALAAMLPKRKDRGVRTGATLGGKTTKAHGREPFTAFWLYLKGAPGRFIPGMTCRPQWQWPDKDNYGQAKDGSVRRRIAKVPYRVRRWRKRAAARLCAQRGVSMKVAHSMVREIEANVVRGIVQQRQAEQSS